MTSTTLVNYYQILNIASNSNEAEIKGAFRKLAKKYHPDINKTAEAPEKFKKVYMAYEVLSDPFKKRLYDELLASANNENEQQDKTTFNYDAGFEEWEYRAEARANHYADMRYEQFKKQELNGFEFIYHQLALFFGVIVLFLIGGGALYFSKNVIVAVINGKASPYSIIGAIILIVFAFTILWYVMQMTKAFGGTFWRKLKKSKP